MPPGNSVIRWLAALLVLLGADSAVFADSPAPALFDAGHENHLGLTFSPDGQAAYWVEWDGRWGDSAASNRQIYVSTLANGSWSEPARAAFSSTYSDDDPFVSPDGRWLYFVSDRPLDSADETPDTNIWRYDLLAGRGPEPVPVNSAAAEYSPVITASGSLYFASDRAGGFGQGDIYRSVKAGNGFLPPLNLGPAINRTTGEWNLWISADESWMLIEASSRPGNVSIPGDLYISWNTASGWSAALPVKALNSSSSDLMPRQHPGTDTFYYTRAPIGGTASIETASGDSLPRKSDYAPILIVANRSSHEVTFVDLAAGEVSARVATGAGPHLLSNVSDGKIIATGYGEFPRPHTEPVTKRPPFVTDLNSRLSVIDVETQAALLEAVVDDCTKPHASWIIGDRVYVTCEDEQQVVSLALQTGKVLARQDTLQEGSHVLAYDATSNTLVVSNTGSGSVSLLPLSGGKTRVLELDNGSEASLAQNGKVWVANASAGSVSVVDAGTRSVVQHIDSVCNFPIAMSAADDDIVWVACFGSAELVAINTATYSIEQRIKLLAQPLHVLRHPTRPLAYVSLPRKNAVAEIDLISGEEVRRIPVGIEPDGLRWGNAVNR